MQEEWRDVVGYEGLYQVSNIGRVRSLGHDTWHPGRVLKPSLDGKGNYYQVGLHKDKKIKHFQIHRLVAIAFLPNPNNLPQVNHKDECKTNNIVSNLEWCTISYNSRYGEGREKMIQSRRANNNIDDIVRKVKDTKKKNNSYSAEKTICQYSLNGDFIRIWASATDAERVMGICRSGIVRCCNGVYRQARGYIWRWNPPTK